jgi:hypothetical protein
MRLAVQNDVVSFVCDWFRSYLIYVVNPFFVLVFDLFDLVLQNLQLTFLVFKFVCVDVDLSLETCSFTFVDRIVCSVL